MAAYDERFSDADRRSREHDRRVEQTFAIQMWLIGFFTGGSFTMLAWLISRGG